MKSNEEFIAGIYEKAAVYTEEKETKTVKVNWVAKATRIAAMAAVCIGLAGIGSTMLGDNNKPSKVPQPSDENYGIALTSETGDDAEGMIQLRVGPEVETVTFSGVVERVDAEGGRITIKLLSDDSFVTIKWDMMEPISKEVVPGVQLLATGILSEYNGCTELVLTDIENLEIK